MTGRPPINRARPVDEDEDEVRELHAAEIAMGLGEDAGPGRSLHETVLQESGVVHQGRLGAAIQTLRLQSSTIRRFFGRFQFVEDRAELALDRVAVVEWTCVILLGWLGLQLLGLWAGMGLFVACRVWLWLAAWWAP